MKRFISGFFLLIIAYLTSLYWMFFQNVIFGALGLCGIIVLGFALLRWAFSTGPLVGGTALSESDFGDIVSEEDNSSSSKVNDDKATMRALDTLRDEPSEDEKELLAEMERQYELSPYEDTRFSALQNNSLEKNE